MWKILNENREKYLKQYMSVKGLISLVYKEHKMSKTNHATIRKLC